MRHCCPEGHGCNAPDGDEACALSLCGRAAAQDPDAATALARWREWQEACQPAHSESERRFRRRAFQRARDRALIGLALRRDHRGRRQSRRIRSRRLASV
jgi:hypothetical protein